MPATRDGARLDLGVGDFCGFPAGPKGMHSIVHETDLPAIVLVIASNPEDDSVVYGWSEGDRPLP